MENPGAPGEDDPGHGYAVGMISPRPGRGTIVAVASAPGIGALAVIRLSGPQSVELLAGLIGGTAHVPPVRHLTLRRLRSPDGDPLDEALVVRFEAPHSYTGEDAVEITCHGGWVTSTRIVAALVELGAAPAEPGEFTRRALLNGRMDLLQAEAVNDLIRAESSAGAQQALRQLDGGLSARIATLRDQLLSLEALIAYDLDFPEEDDGPVTESRVRAAVDGILGTIDALIASSPAGELVRNGAVVAIVGPPNVGKSSLFNALLGRKRALVTDLPGTTRDALEAVLDVLPVPLRLVDTAGLREAADEVERLGVEVSRDFLRNASVVLACGDTPETLQAAQEMARADASGLVLAVRTKLDLAGKSWRAPDDVVGVSAKDGSGLDALVQRVSTAVAREIRLPDPDTPRVTRARHREVLTRAREELIAFRAAREEGVIPPTVIAVHLREALHILEELVGAVDIDEILGRVFSSFCVGK